MEVQEGKERWGGGRRGRERGERVKGEDRISHILKASLVVSKTTVHLHSIINYSCSLLLVWVKVIAQGSVF